MNMGRDDVDEAARSKMWSKRFSCFAVFCFRVLSMLHVMIDHYYSMCLEKLLARPIPTCKKKSRGNLWENSNPARVVNNLQGEGKGDSVLV